MLNKLVSHVGFAHDKPVRLLLFAIAALACCLDPASLMASPTINYVQGNYATPQTPQTTVNVTFTAAQTVGNLNVVVVGWNDTTALVSSVTDKSGNTYTRAVGPTVLSPWLSQSIYYARNIKAAAAGANSVKVTFSTAAAYPDIRILEYSGADLNNPVDGTAASSGNSATSSSGPVTTTNPTDLLFGANIVLTVTTGAGAGFTSRLLTSPDGDIAEDQMVAATGSYSTTAPLRSGQWIMQMVAFRTPAGSVVTPTAPSNLMATAAGPVQINLSWTASTETGGTISQYLIERCAGATCSNYVQVGTSATTTFSNTGLLGSTTYSYRVRAIDTTNNTGPYSNTASATTAAPTFTAPSALMATAAGPAQTNLSWTAATETGGTISQYLIERCTGTTCSNFVQVGTSATTAFNNTGLTGSTTYSYRVRATDASNNFSAYSNTTSATTAAPTFTAPSALTATAAGNTQINLSWTAATETGGTITQYLIERCQGAGCATFAQIATPTATTYSDTGLAATTSYSYRVRATDAAGNLSPYSNVASATTLSSTTTIISYVQGNYATPQTSQTTVGVKYNAAQIVGDLNVVVVGWNDSTSTVSAVTDTAGNGYTRAVGPTVLSGSLSQSIYYAKNIAAAAAGANTVTVTFSIAAAYPDIRILEYSGADLNNPVDGTAANSGNSATSSSGPVATTNPTDLLFGANIVLTVTTGPGTGFTSRLLTSPDGDIAEDQMVAATGSYSATAPLRSGQWIMQMVAFRTPVSGGDTQPPTAPSNLTATVASGSQINLSWTASTDNVGVTGYLVERCQGAGCTTFAQIATPTTTSFNDTGLIASTSYSYRVRATDAASNLSGFSNTATATTQVAPISVSISPRRGGVVTSQTLPLTAAVNNDTGSAGVTWTTTGGTLTGQTPASATFSSAAAGSFTVTAKSNADNTKSASVTIGVTDLTGVSTYHNNPSRDGTNTQEYALTTSNVNTSSFGKLFSCAVDGEVYAQPLWVPNLAIGGSTHNVIFVATQNDSVYAFDADANPCVQYWQKSFLGTGITPVPPADTREAFDINKKIGITGTPVIDVASKTLYVVAKTKETASAGCSVSAPCYFQRLHAMSLVDGTEKFGGPMAITSTITVPGSGDTGDTSVGCTATSGNVPFCPLREGQRAGLALAGGNVYVAWASHGDVQPYHGWIMSFNASNLAQAPAVFNDSPNGRESGIWMSGGAPAFDSSNNLYVITGNGDYDGANDLGDSFLKLNSGLVLQDWFTPFVQGTLDSLDLDLGSGGAIVLVDLPSSTVPHVLIGGGKGTNQLGQVYVVNRDSMGQNANPDKVVQAFDLGGMIYSTAAFWQNAMYIAGVGQTLKAFALNTSTSQFNTVATSQSSHSYGFPGTTPVVSSAGTTNGTGIVWALDTNSTTAANASGTDGPAVLYAYDALNLGTALWDSTQGSGNAAGNAVKFCVPTVANGKVYIGTATELTVYGLLPN